MRMIMIMDTTTDQPNSICHVQPIQMYQLPTLDQAPILPFNLLAGEGLFHHGTSVDGLIVLTNYRLYLQIGQNHHHVPLGLIEVVEHRELFYLHIGCKDARTYRCTFENNESCLEWFDRISKAAEPPRQLEQLFAFYHFIWATTDQEQKQMRNGKLPPLPPPPPIIGGSCSSERSMCIIPQITNYNCTSSSSNNIRKRYYFDNDLFKSEMERLGFEGDSWRITEANKEFKLCPSYPPKLIVPSCLTDENLEAVAKFRSARRIPAVVWRHTGNGAVIARSSQPEVGWLGWRSGEDEDLIKALSQACNFDQGTRNQCDKESVLSHSPGSLHSEDSLQITAEINVKEKKVLIMDARSYTSAVANRARGGGCECPEYYPNCEIQFMNLANIHVIRKSFHAVRQLCTASADQPNWWSQLENTRWLQHMSGLMKAALTLVNVIEREARPVLVHCSDGWDRTSQIVALAELLLDPYYRTMEGFRILIEREWLAFGHKFGDRCGHSAGSNVDERCPVFLQWLDCVHQLLLQFSCAFEFSHTYLVKLTQHVYSNLYGTFLCNTFQERMKIVNGKTFSVWEFLSSPRFKNHLYAPPGNSCGNKVLWPQCNVRDLQLWNEVYLGTWEANFSTDGGSGSCPGPPESSPQHMTKTRSYGDLINAPDVCTNQSAVRRSSDPSINIDKKLTVLTSESSQELSSTAQDMVVNGHNLPLSAPQPINNKTTIITTQATTNGGTSDFLSHHNNDDDDGDGAAVEDEDDEIIECNTDCIYKNNRRKIIDVDDVYDDIEEDCTDSPQVLTELLINNTKQQQHVKCNNIITRIAAATEEEDKSSTSSSSNQNNVDVDFLLQDVINGDKTDRQIDNMMSKRYKNGGTMCLLNNTAATTTSTTISNSTTFNNTNITTVAPVATTTMTTATTTTNNIIINDINDHNGNDIDENFSDNDENECTEKSESKSENTICCDGIIASLDVGRSVETSTDTLVSENVNISSSPVEINGFEKLQSPTDLVIDKTTDECKICAQNLKFVNDSHSKETVAAAAAGKSSKYSNNHSVSNSRTTSGSDWDNSLNNLLCDSQKNKWQTHPYSLGDDGLVPVRSEAQERLWQIIQEHRRKEELLEKELHTYRQALLNQFCHKCSNNENDKVDDNSDTDSDNHSLSNSNSCSPQRILSPVVPSKLGSVVESLCSGGEGPVSAGESIRSDLSWENLEENRLLPECTTTLWVPDHAVDRCMGCQTMFWAGRRKHHCRKCGNIFCASCSEHSTPLPSEQLYNPVRVCTGCYSKLRRDCGELLPEQCKHTNGQQHPTNTNPQITASSN